MILLETPFAADPNAPLWQGRTELRTANLVNKEDLIKRMQDLMKESKSLGWLKFAKKHNLPGSNS